MKNTEEFSKTPQEKTEWKTSKNIINMNEALK
jgi:hypothetical protein